MSSWTELILPEDRDYAVKSMQRMRNGEWVTFECRIRRPSDWEVRCLRSTDFLIQDQKSRVVRIGGVVHDVTVLKTADEALATAEQRQRVLLEAIPQLVWRAVNRGHRTWAVPQWSEYTGQAETDSHGQGWLATIHPEDRQNAREAWD